MRTIDGGLSWEEQFFNYDFKKVFFTDINTGYITVGNGIILFTTNGGNTWEEQFINSSADLFGIYFIDKDNGWIVGYNSTILHTSNGGTVGIEDASMPEKSHLQVNSYPNPFSTSTTIEYELKHPETVSITFYNSFGRVVDIIEEHQSQGLQKAVWTPENLPEGIYHFRLQAGEQSGTGKIILLK